MRLKHTLIYTLSFRMGTGATKTAITVDHDANNDTSAASPHPTDVLENATAHASHPPGPSLVQPDTCGVPAGILCDEEKIAERPQLQLRQPQIAKEGWDLKAQQEVQGKSERIEPEEAKKADDDEVGGVSMAAGSSLSKADESEKDFLKNCPREAAEMEEKAMSQIEEVEDISKKKNERRTNWCQKEMASGQMKDQAKKLGALKENALQEKDVANKTESEGYEKVVPEKAWDKDGNDSVDKWEQPQEADIKESKVQDNDKMHAEEHAKIEVEVTAEVEEKAVKVTARGASQEQDSKAHRDQQCVAVAKNELRGQARREANEEEEKAGRDKPKLEDGRGAKRVVEVALEEHEKKAAETEAKKAVERDKDSEMGAERKGKMEANVVGRRIAIDASCTQQVSIGCARSKSAAHVPSQRRLHTYRVSVGSARTEVASAAHAPNQAKDNVQDMDAQEVVGGAESRQLLYQDKSQIQGQRRQEGKTTGDADSLSQGQGGSASISDGGRDSGGDGALCTSTSIGESIAAWASADGVHHGGCGFVANAAR